MIDFTPGSETSNSYVQKEYADLYFTSKVGGEKWNTFSTEEKERLLVTATYEIDLFVWGGQKATSIQALQWPRNFLIDELGNTIEGIPSQLRRATCEMAYWIWTEDERLLPDVALEQVDDFKAGPLSLKIKPNAKTVPDIVQKILRSIGPGAFIGTDPAALPVSFSR